jgi:hypothetical protein
MKFKINKMQVDLLAKKFETKNPMSFEEIELEPVWETANEACFQQEQNNKYFRQGYNRGYDDGYFNAKNNRERCQFCGKSRLRMYQCYCCTEAGL